MSSLHELRGRALLKYFPNDLGIDSAEYAYSYPEIRPLNLSSLDLDDKEAPNVPRIAS
jgi:hypothetical protein